ncbi:MAG: MFS transporter [Anaerolineaceae bacterium]|nr:MFS transporter [Anaerolineaceae bacterium]
MRTYIPFLRENSDFTRVWVAQIISLFGDWFNIIALSALVAQYTNQSGLAVSGLLLARVLPPFLISPFAGVLVDRFDRKRLLIISDVLRTMVGLSLMLATSADRLWIIYGATIFQFVFSAIFEPARSALLPALLPREQLIKANTLSNVTWSVMLAIGAMIGGIITAIFGTTTALIVDAASFGVSALILMSVRVNRNIEHTKPTLHKSAHQTGFKDGLTYVRKHPQIGIVLLVKFGLSVGNVDTLMIAYGTALFVVGKNGTGSLGLLYAAFGLGALLGPALLNRYSNGQVMTMRRLMIIGFAWVTLGWFLLGLAPSLWFAALALVVRAMGGSTTWTYSSTVIQMSTENAYLGRIFSLDWAAYYFAVTVSTLVTGRVLDAVGSMHAPEIALVTGVLSLIPLVGWIAAVRWAERYTTRLAVVNE